MKVGNRIKELRTKRGLTQEALAEKAGISRQHLSAIEAPNICRPISMDLLFNLANVLQIEPYQLLQFRQE